jgi:hypothetical protein
MPLRLAQHRKAHKDTAALRATGCASTAGTAAKQLSYASYLCISWAIVINACLSETREAGGFALTTQRIKPVRQA